MYLMDGTISSKGGKGLESLQWSTLRTKPDITKYCLERSDLLVRNEPFYIPIENIGLKRSFGRPSQGKTA